MGRSRTLRYRLVMDGGDFGHVMGWDTCRYNPSAKPKPSTAAIGKFLSDLVESCKPGGCNDHITKSLGRLPKLPRRAVIVAQLGTRAGETVAEWEAPAAG